MKRNTLHKMLFASAIAVAGSFSAQAQGTITTIAGTGISGFGGDGGAAIEARLASPSGVAADAEGNIYIADKNNNRIRKVNPTGVISSYAGDGVPGWMVAGMPLRYPVSAFVDASGEVLFTGWMNDMGYYTTESGVTHARFGCGSQGSTGDGGNCLLAKTMTPSGSCEDNYGNTYIADFGSNRIRRVDVATGIITTIVNGTGTHGYSGDGGDAMAARTSGLSAVFVDPTSPGAGHLYFAEANNNVIRKVDLNTGIISTVAGNGSAGYSGNWGLATDAKLRNPGSIFIDHNKMLYFCDRGNNVVRAFNLVRKVVYTVAGNGTAGFSGDGDRSEYAQLSAPNGVWVDNSGNMYIADANNQRIRKVTLGVYTTLPKQSQGGFSGLDNGTIRVYPNPANGIVNINVGADFANANVTVLNTIGQEVYNGTLAGQLNQVDLSNMASGAYTLIVKSGNNKHIEKITLQ